MSLIFGGEIRPMQDIANTALFFASNMSANITGQALLSDGGTSIKAHDMDC